MKKLNVWIITDEEPNYIDMYLRQWRYDEELCNHVKKHLSYKKVGSWIQDCMNLIGTPDVIMIDMGSITSTNTALQMDYDIPRLLQFCKDHSSSIIHIMSYVDSWANDTKEELIEYLKDEVVIETGHNGDEAIANYMADKVCDYYPYKGV